VSDDRRAARAQEPLDDRAIEQLVRDVADGWTMPPVRLDAPSWRERVRTPRARRLAAASGWLARIGQAATAAVALTVAAAFVAVMITRPPDAGESAAPSPGGSGEARATLLPKLLMEGDLPDPSEVLVQTEDGDFALVDLAAGTIGGPITGARYGSRIHVRPDGSLVCLCVSESGSVGGSPTNATVSLDKFDPTGKLTSSAELASFAGEPDPRDVGHIIPERPPHVLTAVSFSADGEHGFVGWSRRADPSWESGIIAVDIRQGTIVSEIPLPVVSSGEGDSRRVAGAPRVVGTTVADGLLLARDWYAWTPPASERPHFSFGSDVFKVRLSLGRWRELDPVTFSGDCGSTVLRGGALPDGGLWFACGNGGSARTVLRRITAEGRLLPDISASGPQGIDDDPTALSPDGSTLFAWNAETAVLTRMDIASGETARGNGLSARAAGPLTAVGEWLAPAAAAKAFLRGAVLVSPDGTRVYAVGITEGVEGRDTGGSAGVFVFDSTTLETLGTWQPTADFISLATNHDGRFLYVAGMPGVDVRGRHRPDQQASITVLDTADGSIRIIAGALGPDMITFPSTVIR
jgi:hypothetical protein